MRRVTEPIWSCDLEEDRTHEGRKVGMPNIPYEYMRKCLAIRVDRRLNSASVIDVLSAPYFLRGVPGHIRSDNRPVFVAKTLQA